MQLCVYFSAQTRVNNYKNNSIFLRYISCVCLFVFFNIKLSLRIKAILSNKHNAADLQVHVFEKFLITCKLYNYIFFFQFSVSTICLSFNCRCYGDVHQVVLWRPKQRQRYPSQLCTSSYLCSTLWSAVLGYFYCRYVFVCLS